MYPHAGAGMRGGVAGFHGYGLKGDDCGLKGDFFLFFLLYRFYMITMFFLFTDVPNYRIGSF